MLYKYILIFQFYPSNSTCFYNLDTNKNLPWDLKVCIVLIQKSLHYLENICSFSCFLYALSFIYSGIYFSQIRTLPLKSLAISNFHNVRYDIFSFISYCNSNGSSLIFIVLDLLSRVIFCMYQCSVYAIQGFSAMEQHEEDMKTFIH